MTMKVLIILIVVMTTALAQRKTGFRFLQQINSNPNHQRLRGMRSSTFSICQGKVCVLQATGRPSDFSSVCTPGEEIWKGLLFFLSMGKNRSEHPIPWRLYQVCSLHSWRCGFQLSRTFTLQSYPASLQLARQSWLPHFKYCCPP
ncbi:uncharacterized protein LOC110860362 isoform X2 [Folsomia candida]|uniref:uncharacterized protein LOC110860362 isoform X2 n=1 Tax=Folsomia candida TaxID=158441 RepID=UPI001604BCBA|nr:uncharacterized protein LOC110860362 isoform X2 [Folsomia candida]